MTYKEAVFKHFKRGMAELIIERARTTKGRSRLLVSLTKKQIDDMEKASPSKRLASKGYLIDILITWARTPEGRDFWSNVCHRPQPHLKTKFTYYVND